MQNLICGEDGDSCEDDGEQEAVDGATHHAFEHEVQGLEVGDFAAGALLGDASQPLVAQRAVAHGGEQDGAVAGDVLNLVAAGVKESYMLAIAANLNRLLGELLPCAAAVAPLYKCLYKRLLQLIQSTRRDAFLAACQYCA